MPHAHIYSAEIYKSIAGTLNYLLTYGPEPAQGKLKQQKYTKQLR